MRSGPSEMVVTSVAEPGSVTDPMVPGAPICTCITSWPFLHRRGTRPVPDGPSQFVPGNGDHVLVEGARVVPVEFHPLGLVPPWPVMATPLLALVELPGPVRQYSIRSGRGRWSATRWWSELRMSVPAPGPERLWRAEGAICEDDRRGAAGRRTPDLQVGVIGGQDQRCRCRAVWPSGARAFPGRRRSPSVQHQFPGGGPTLWSFGVQTTVVPGLGAVAGDDAGDA